MLKSIGFIGYGFVGQACHRAFKHNTEAIIIDPKHSETTWNEFAMWQPRLTFVSLPAPTLEDGSVDAAAIYAVFQQLADIKYDGLVVLKSTLPPDIVHDLYVKFGHAKIFNKTGPLKYIYSPEFLREANWEKDAVEPVMMILAGEFLECKEVEEIYKNHSHIGRYTRFFFVDYKEAAFAKYAINTFLATKVVFMNQLYQLYADMYGKSPIHPETWQAMMDMLSADTRFGHSHLQVPGPDGNFGYGGTCFPKDVKAFVGCDKNERLTILREVEHANTQIRLTGDGKTP
jgi:UDPglucose 6-dehydrogenase